MICILGDIHFNASKDYFRATCEAFLEWFKTWEMNTPSNYLVLAGDVVQDSINGGIVVRYLEMFYQYSNFKEIHIVVGNHDLKKVNNISQLAYDFYREKPNFFIHDKATELLVGTKKFLMLPYFTGLNADGLSMSELYSSIASNPTFSNDYDAVVGHFCGEDTSFPGSTDCVKNLDKLSGRVCLGHIHTRFTNPGRYIGSVYAGNKTENDETRAVWILKDDGAWYEEKLPIFNEFVTVTYPEALPASKARVPIYTILNCASENNAIHHYGNIFIRRTTLSDKDIRSSKKANDAQDIANIRNLSTKQLFREFITSQAFSDSVIKKCEALLEAY